MMKADNSKVELMALNTTSLYCPSCGAYIGEAVPGYMKAAVCYCGELVAVSVPEAPELNPIDVSAVA